MTGVSVLSELDMGVEKETAASGIKIDMRVQKSQGVRESLIFHY